MRSPVRRWLVIPFLALLVMATVTPPGGTLAGAEAHQQSVDGTAESSSMNFTVTWRANGSRNPRRSDCR